MGGLDSWAGDKNGGWIDPSCCLGHMGLPRNIFGHVFFLYTFLTTYFLIYTDRRACESDACNVVTVVKPSLLLVFFICINVDYFLILKFL